VTQLVENNVTIGAMSPVAVGKVQALEDASLVYDQLPVETHHLIHGGMYCRTMHMTPGMLITGALIKISTTLIIAGHVTVYLDGEPAGFHGYYVLPAAGGRKQAIYAHEASYLTMLFPTDVDTVGEAEAQFTDAVDTLSSRAADAINKITVTGV
jgi:hypothetical protein